MSKSLKIILFTISGFTGSLVFVGFGMLFFVNTNANKLRLEAIASETLGMEVRVEGRMSIRFFSDLSVTGGFNIVLLAENLQQVSKLEDSLKSIGISN